MSEIQAFQVRFPADEHQALKLFCTVTGQSMNEVVVHAVRQFLVGEGRAEQLDSFLQTFRDEYRVALDKLAE